MSGESLTRSLSHQKLHATAIRDLAYSVLVAEHTGPSTRAQNVGLALFYRAQQTHEAVQILINNMLVEDAEALVRVLIEQIVNAVYMLFIADENCAEDYVQYPKFKNYIVFKHLLATNEARARKSVSVEDEEVLRKVHESLLPRFKGRPVGGWCADELYMRATKVDQKLSQMRSSSQFEYLWLVNSTWRFASSHVHSMADSILDQVTRAEGRLVIEQKYVEEDAATALYSANFAVALPLPLIDLMLGARKAPEVRDEVKAFMAPP